MRIPKTILILLFIFLLSKTLISQSVSVYAGYPYYFMQLEEHSYEVKQKTNYITGFSVNKYAGLSKLEVGFAYATKDYSYYHYYKNIKTEETHVHLNNYFIPLIFNNRIFTDSINTFSLSFGTVFIKPSGYYTDRIFRDSTTINSENKFVLNKWDYSLRIGFKYSRLLSAKLILFSELYGNYKFNPDNRGSAIQYLYIEDDRFDMGINIGLELLFNKKKLDYYRN